MGGVEEPAGTGEEGSGFEGQQPEVVEGGRESVQLKVCVVPLLLKKWLLVKCRFWWGWG